MRRMVCVLVLMSCMLLAVMPADAADYTLGIFGNANMDDTIDEDDIAYVEGIIKGTNERTELADANYDSEVDEDDITQIEQIISGDEKELTIIDSADRNITVHKPVERIIVLESDAASAVKILGATNKVVGVNSVVLKKGYYFPELSDKPSVGYPEYDYEAILSLDPDLVMYYGSGSYYKPKLLEIAEKLPGITVVGLDFYKQKTLRSEVAILGYVLNKEDNAEEYNAWCKNSENNVKNFVDTLEPEEKPKVFMTMMKGYPGELKTFGPSSGCDILCTLAGGANIAGELPATYPKVDSEWVITENPDVIITFEYYTGQGWVDTTDPEELRNKILNVEEWTQTSAVENNGVYVCNYELLFGLDSVVGLTYWAKFLHPDSDLDPEGVSREYYEMLNVIYPEDLIQAYPQLEES
jgi:ABC-type Fe3+-hydroxamate transport system, periplasmic component